MYVLKNAIKNIFRNKGRNFLFAVIVLAIILTTVVSVIINNTTKEIIDDYKTRFGTEVVIDYDYEALSNVNSSEFKLLTLQNYMDFSESELLKETVFYGSVMLTMKSIKPVSGNVNFEDPRYAEAPQGNSDIQGVMEQEEDSPNGSLIGTNKAGISEDFESGARKIVQGQMAEKKGECVVSEQLAKLNGLAVGDSLEIMVGASSDKLHKLVVTGIFEDLTMLPENNSYEEYSEIGNRNNEILTVTETISDPEMLSCIEGEVPFSVFYTLKDPMMLDAFKKELSEKGLPSYYQALTDEQSYSKIVGPVEGMAKITTTFLIVVLILGSLVLVVLSAFSIRERKYEIGVLRAIGMSKGKVAQGLVFEMVLITSICLVIGLGAGSAVSQPVADSLLNSQIELLQEDHQSGMTENTVFGRKDPSREEAVPLKEVTVGLNGTVVLTIIMISFLLTLVSTISGILYITKLEPMKILSERS